MFLRNGGRVVGGALAPENVLMERILSGDVGYRRIAAPPPIAARNSSMLDRVSDWLS